MFDSMRIVNPNIGPKIEIVPFQCDASFQRPVDLSRSGEFLLANGPSVWNIA